MGSKQRVAVSDIVKTLFATNQQTITKEKAVQLFDQVFRQAKEADRVLDYGMAHPYVPFILSLSLARIHFRMSFYPPSADQPNPPH